MNVDEFKKYLFTLDDDGVVEMRAIVESEMVSRNLTIDVGKLGEKLAIEYFNSKSGLPNLIAAPKGAKNVDALSRDGERYSIKAVMKAKKTGTVYPDSAKPDKQLFEHLLLVCLNSKYQMEAFYSFGWDKFLEARAWDKRMNAWYVPVSQKRLKIATKLFPKD